ELSDDTLYEIIAAFDAADIDLYSMQLYLMDGASWKDCLTIPAFRINSLGLNLSQPLEEI
ncbi:MAG TPA: hypothetical protein DCE71_03835, partial [Parachlamydiales bacterium]|nr:hypothetical protein [Parachlamydiales bacterium]